MTSSYTVQQTYQNHKHIKITTWICPIKYAHSFVLFHVVLISFPKWPMEMPTIYGRQHALATVEVMSKFSEMENSSPLVDSNTRPPDYTPSSLSLSLSLYIYILYWDVLFIVYLMQQKQKHETWKPLPKDLNSPSPCNKIMFLSPVVKDSLSWEITILSGRVLQASFHMRWLCQKQVSRVDRDNPDSKVHWGQHGAQLGPTGPRWATCWPHEPCYLGSDYISKILYDVITCPSPWYLPLAQHSSYILNPWILESYVSMFTFENQYNAHVLKQPSSSTQIMCSLQMHGYDQASILF